MTSLVEASVLLLLLGAFSFLCYKRRWLDNEGILIANIVGLSTFLLGGKEALATLFVFFVVAEGATYFIKGKKHVHYQRNTGNILGNALAAIVALLLNSQLGFFAAISASLADTLSSEIGILSKTKPWLITTLKRVEPGTDGAVSELGLLAAVGGAVIISVLGFLFGVSVARTLIVVVAGVLGSLFDSLMGATIQKKSWVDNNEVNFLGSSFGAIAAVVLSIILGLG